MPLTNSPGTIFRDTNMARRMLAANITATRLRDAGWSAASLLVAGYNPAEVCQAGGSCVVPASDFKAAGAPLALAQKFSDKCDLLSAYGVAYLNTFYIRHPIIYEDFL